jgi:hypothetical protein
MNMSSTPAAADARPAKSFTRFIPVFVRWLMGLPLLVGGLNSFFHFFPEPKPQISEAALAFAGALVQTGYMMPLIAATHIFVALTLLTNRFVPLGLAVFAAFMVNSLAFHIYLERTGLPMAIVFGALEIYLAWVYRAAFRPMLAARTPIN